MEELYEYRTDLIASSLRVSHQLKQAMEAISAADLYSAPGAGLSNPHRTLAHLRDIQVHALSGRLRQILTEENPSFILFDDEGWQASHYREDEPWQAVLEEFRLSQWQVLEGLDPKEAAIWNRTATHPWFGKRTFQWWMELCHEYAETHLAQIVAVKPGVEGKQP